MKNLLDVLQNLTLAIAVVSIALFSNFLLSRREVLVRAEQDLTKLRNDVERLRNITHGALVDYAAVLSQVHISRTASRIKNFEWAVSCQSRTRLLRTAVLDRRGKRLFSGGDDLFSRVAAELGLRFGVFPELCITHLISAGRSNLHYLVRLIHDHALSHGVLDYMFDGIQPVRTDLVRYGRLLLHAVKNGPFSMRCQWAESQGSDGAAQFISANRLKPLGPGRSESSLGGYLSPGPESTPG